ncbi:MAG: flagellar basal body L-ring protein FlgH [bacterium]|nr:flagellar basal body L-ring protein FlgH [bacterium]
MNIPATLVAILLLSGVCAPAAFGQSLWQQRDPRRVNIYHDSKARSVGDVLTIVISETTDVDNNDQRAMDKSTGATAAFGLNGATSSGGVGGDVSGTGNLTASATNRFDGSSQVTVERQFTDSMTVMVLDVLPNGNLIVGGKRRRIVAGEERTLMVSGIVRPLDIAINNSVNSLYIANFQVNYEGEGPDSRFTTKRFLPRVWESLWAR